MKTILSIDPSGSSAGHSGVALVGYGDDTPATLLASWAVQGGLEPFRKWHRGQFPQWVHRPSMQYVPGADETWVDTVIVEHFVNRNVPGADISPVGIEYVVRWLWPDAVLSPASGKNTAVPDQALKNLGMYEDKSHHHDIREASRHAIWWLKKQGHVPTLRKGWGK